MITVADPGFSRGGYANSHIGIICKFLPKLHENERIWTPRAGHVSLVPLLDPPMD